MNAIDASKQWLEKIVIGLNFCPFAKPEHDDGRIKFVISESTGFEAGLEALIKECEALSENNEVETTLLIFTKQLNDFEEFLDFIELANQLLTLQNYDGVYQLAHFHPQYCFDEIDGDDAANYTNRSPLPMLHLIREESIERALKNYPYPDQIPERNIEKARNLGQTYFQELLHSSGKEQKE